MGDNIDYQYQVYREADAEASLYRSQGSQLIEPPSGTKASEKMAGITAEEEALGGGPLGATGEVAGKVLEEIGKVGSAVTEKVIKPSADIAGKALGLDLPEGGAGEALSFVAGLPEEGVGGVGQGLATIGAAIPLAGLIGKTVGKAGVILTKTGTEAKGSRYLIHGKDGRELGSAVLSRDGDILNVNWIEGKFNPSELRGALENARQQPEFQGVTKVRGAQVKDILKGKKSAAGESVPVEFKIKPLDPALIEESAAQSASILYKMNSSFYSPIGGRYEGLSAFAVPIYKEYNRTIKGMASQADIKRYIDDVSKQLDLNTDAMAVEATFNRADGTTNMSINLVVPRYKDAEKLGQLNGLESIVDLQSGMITYIPPGAKGAANEAGKVSSSMVTSLAFSMLGGAYGYAASEPDDKILATMAGAGLGAILPRMALAMARSLTRAVSTTAKPGQVAPPSQLLHDISAKFRKEMKEFVYEQPHDVTREKAAQELVGGLSDNFLERSYPGIAANSVNMAKSQFILKDELNKLMVAAKNYSQIDNSEAAETEFLNLFAVVAHLEPRYFGLESEAGRTLEFTKDMSDAANQFVNQFRGLTGVMRLGHSSRHIADIVSSMKTEEQLLSYARWQGHPGLIDMFLESWVNGLISGPVTHVTNIMSTGLSMLSSVPERALAAGFGRAKSALTGKPAGVVSGEAQVLMQTYYQSAGLAWDLAIEAFKKDRPIFGQSKFERTTAHAITGDNMNRIFARKGIDPMSAGWTKAWDYMGVVARVPGRALMATDEYFKQIVFRGEIAAQARRVATNAAQAEGIAGPAYAKRIADLEGQFLADPDKIAAFRGTAEQFAAYTTFTIALGESGQALQLLMSHPLGRIIAPFIRTPINLVKYAGERTPFALASKAVLTELRAGGARADLAMSKIAAGSSMMAIAMFFAANGVLTGYGPNEKTTREIWKTDGRQPYSFNVTGMARLLAFKDPSPQMGDQWISYSRQDPIAIVLGLAADSADLMVQLDDPNLRDELGARLLIMGGNLISSKTYVQGMASWFLAATDPAHYGERVSTTLAGSLITTIPGLGPALKQSARAWDPTLRETRGWIDGLAANVPGWSQTLRPKYNYWGETQLKEGWMLERALSPLYRSTHYKDPVVEKLVSADVSLTPPTDIIDGIQLNNEQYADLRLAFGHVKAHNGKTLYKAMSEVLNTYYDMTDVKLRTDPESLLHLRLKAVDREYKELAKQSVREKYPELGRARGENLRERVDKLHLKRAPQIGIQ